MLEQLRQNKAKIQAIAAKYGASNIRIFGSCAANTMTPNSDIDFLMDIEPGHSLLERIQLMQELEDLLDRKVDIAKPATLHETIKAQILQQAIEL
jgi:predicted nucleotidyltransferase